jgi:hypothetical protein
MADEVIFRERPTSLHYSMWLNRLDRRMSDEEQTEDVESSEF